MIGRVRGSVIDRIDSTHHCLVTVLVSGIGVEVMTTKNDLEGTSRDGEVEFFTDFVVREDSMTLYGFLSSARRSLFRSLQKVTGVGPKLALTILAATDADELVGAIIDGDIAYLERIPGIGKKVASRISLELREKMALSASGFETRTSHLRGDVISALVNLGYSEREASSATAELSTNAPLDVALKEALSLLNRTK